MTDDELLAEARAIVVLFALIRHEGKTPIYDTLIQRYYTNSSRYKELTTDGKILHSLVFDYRYGRIPITQENLDETRSKITRRTPTG